MAAEVTLWRPTITDAGRAWGPSPRLSVRDRILNRLAFYEVQARYRWTIYRESVIAAREARERVRDEARAASEIARIEQHQQSILRREMKHASRCIVARLTQLEFARIIQKGKNFKVSRVKFAQAAATPSAFYLRVDTVHMPRGRGVTTENLSDPEVLHELSLATGAAVDAYRHYEKGFWFIVQRSGGIGAIPAFVEYDEVWRQIPKTAGPLDIPLGIGANRRFYHADIADMPHLLIAGTTGFGKSVMLHNILVTIIQRNRPERVKLVLVDLKGGAGLGPYKTVPHLLNEQRGDDGPEIDMTDGATIETATVSKRARKHENFLIEPRIYDKREDVIQVLRRLNYEIERRFQVFQRAGARDLPGYNHKNPSKRLPLIVGVFDEIQNVMLDRASRHDAESLLTDIASRSRAAGVHLVISTQRPSADVITGLIKANFPARIAFTTASGVDSRVILDAGDAADLGRKGLLIFQSELRRYRCQCAYVSEGFVDDVVAKAVEGRIVSDMEHAVGKLDMVRWALKENGGKFSIDDVYRAFRPRGVVYHDVKAAMVQVMHETMEIDGTFYRWRKRDSSIVELDETGAFLGELSMEEVARWALTENEGRISQRAVLEAFRTRASEKVIRELLKRADDKVVTVDDQKYFVERGARGMRRVVASAD